VATSKSTVTHFEDALKCDQRLKVKPMFGEYAIYFDDAVVGLICDDQIFIKITSGTKALLPATTSTGEPYPKAKPQFIIDETILDDLQLLSQLLTTARRDLQPVTKRARPAKRT
jgi:TfoX/Sxy family transcriptional regulator of competence genes